MTPELLLFVRLLTRTLWTIYPGARIACACSSWPRSEFAPDDCWNCDVLVLHRGQQARVALEWGDSPDAVYWAARPAVEHLAGQLVP